MGKTKWYSDPEAGQTAGQRMNANQATSSAKQRTGSNLPGKMVLKNPESLPIPELLRLVRLRMRRSWVALRFQANRYTFGAFNHQNALKFSVVALAGWYVLSDPETGLRQISPDFQGASVIETSLNFGSKTSAKPSKVKTKNDAAPVSASELYDEQVKEYISRFSQIAQTEMEKFGIPASISLAQGLIESRAGTSKLAVNNNNHFGIKCFSRHCKKGHCSNFTDDTHKDFFRKFQNPWDSWREHSKLLSSGRYKRLQKCGNNYRQWAYGLKTVGYATDRTYAEKLIGIIERYNLNRFDD